MQSYANAGHGIATSQECEGESECVGVVCEERLGVSDRERSGGKKFKFHYLHSPSQCVGGKSRFITVKWLLAQWIRRICEENV